jgi:peptidoglycan hydrolase CwlO-like protein
MSNEKDDDITEIKVAIALIQKDISSIQKSVAVLNHNSTSLDARIERLEVDKLTSKAIQEHLEASRKNTRNWIVTVGAVMSALYTLFNILRVFGFGI